MLLMGVVERSRRQLGLFRVLLTIVSGIIMALILYTLTLDKLHDIALLKLIGAPNRDDPRADPAAGDPPGCAGLRDRLSAGAEGLPLFPAAGDV